MLCPGHIQSEMLIRPSFGDIKDTECVKEEIRVVDTHLSFLGFGAGMTSKRRE